MGALCNSKNGLDEALRKKKESMALNSGKEQEKTL